MMIGGRLHHGFGRGDLLALTLWLDRDDPGAGEQVARAVFARLIGAVLGDDLAHRCLVLAQLSDHAGEGDQDAVAVTDDAMLFFLM